MKTLATILALAGGLCAYGQQNLVANDSYENYQHCPVSFSNDALELVKEWVQPTKGTSDYYNVCSRSAGVPKNMFGWQMAADGEAYIGLITYAPSKRNYREYLQSKLKTPMRGRQQYCVSFYVSQADYANYLTDGLGVHFSKEPIRTGDKQVLPLPEHLSNPRRHVLYHSKDWILISDIYTASGGEEYITIGNFRSDHDLEVKHRNLNRDTITQVWDYAYYYIDKVMVTPVENVEECNPTVREIQKMVDDPGYPFDYVMMDRMQLDKVYFDFDKTAIKGEYARKLDKAIRLMKRYTSYYLEVHGHTDKIGETEYNDGLSKARAEKVYQYMIDGGIAADRLRIRYFGELNPAEDGEDPETNQANRRVEFELLQL